MASTGADPIGSMGNDAPLAVLSERPQLLYSYFKQLFAQVTNPPVDAIREELIMATDRSIGPEANLLEPGPDAAHQVALPSPILSNAELETIRALDGGPASRGFRTITLPILFKVAENGSGLRRAIEDLRRQASEAIAEGYNQVVLSDRGHSEVDAPIPALLAVSAVHHHLVRNGTRGPGRPRARVRRAARGPPLLPADRVRGLGDQPVPRLRDDRGPGPRRAPSRGPSTRPSSATARPRPRA